MFKTCEEEYKLQPTYALCLFLLESVSPFSQGNSTQGKILGEHEAKVGYCFWKRL